MLTDFLVAAGGSSTIISDVIEALTISDVQKTRMNGKEKEAENMEYEQNASTSSRDVVIAHVYPPECTNLALTMKAIVSGFVERISIDDDTTTSCT